MKGKVYRDKAKGKQVSDENRLVKRGEGAKRMEVEIKGGGKRES